jgi:hypothetical protein
MRKNIKGVKNLLYCEIFVPLKWEILLNRKLPKWAKSVLITWESFSTKLLQYLR